jgi:hypothetical protein
MAKKTVKKEKELKTDILNYQPTDKELELGVRVIPMEEKEYRDVEENPDFTTAGFVHSKETLSSITIQELVAYRSACEILCRHYENLSRLDNKNCYLFNEFREYAASILNEMEIRLRKICKNE